MTPWRTTAGAASGNRTRHSGALQPTLWIVGGPSSVGKTRFLEHPRAREITGLSPDAPVLFPGNLRRDTVLTEDAFLHYNILRPADERIMAAARRAAKDPDGQLGFRDDRRWRLAMRLSIERRAILLVADRDTLLERVRGRVRTEAARNSRYRTDVWLDVYERVDIEAIYDAWRRELDRRGIPLLELDATRDHYPERPVLR